MKKLNLEYFLAKRIASKNGGRKNNVMVRIATFSVAIGMAVMIVSMGVIFGFKQEITQKLSGFGAHLQLVNLDGNASYETVPISKNQPALPYIENLKDFYGLYPYAIKAGILRGENAMEGIVLKGVDQTYDWSFFEQYKTDGEVLHISDTARNKDVMISQALARLMQIKVGDPLDILFIQEPARRDRFRVKGIYDTQFDELDKMMIITDLRNIQRLNNWAPDEITGYEITTTKFRKLEQFTAQVQEQVFEHPSADGHSVRVLNIRDRYPMIFDWLNAHNVNVMVIITVMLLVGLFNMIAALLIILLERTSMIGILKALGMGNRPLQKMFLIRSAFVIFKGMLWGNIIGVGLCLIQYYTGWVTLDQAGYFLTTVPIFINWSWLVLLNLITFIFIVSLLALPTRIISLILPEKSIRFE